MWNILHLKVRVYMSINLNLKIKTFLKVGSITLSNIILYMDVLIFFPINVNILLWSIRTTLIGIQMKNSRSNYANYYYNNMYFLDVKIYAI